MRFQHQSLGNVFNRDDHPVNLACGIKKWRGIGGEQRPAVVGTINGVMNILYRLAGFKNLFQRLGLSWKRMSFRIRHSPLQDTASATGNGVLGQAKDFFRPMIGKGDFPGLIGNDDADRTGFHDMADEIPVMAEVFLGALAFDGITDGAVKNVGVKLAFDEIIGGPGFHGLHVNLMVPLAGQQDHGRPGIELL